MPVSKTKSTRKPKDPIVVVSADQTGKLPPQALEFEEAVLGALMLSREAYPMVAEILKDNAFYKVAHQRIYQAIQDLASQEHPVDKLTVIERLKANGHLEEVGGPLYIANLTQNVASTAHLRYHAQVLAQKALARELIQMAANVAEKAYDEAEDVEDLMQEAEAAIFQISQHSQKKDVVQVKSVVEEAIDRIRKASQNEGNMSGTPSGFDALDEITSGWQKSDLIIIAARPAMGKTAFVLSMLKNMAMDKKCPVAMFSLEMSNVQLVNRILMNVCEIEGDKIRNGKLSDMEWSKLNQCLDPIMQSPIYIDDTPSLSVFELRSKARKLVREHKVQCIIIDYLQLMNATGMTFGSREQEISIISRNLKALAKELDIPIIALSQLNRNVEGRTGIDGKRPQLSDLRESGAIEQDADMVCFIHRPEYYFRKGGDDQDISMIGKAEIIVAKHRNGAVDTVKLQFDKEYARFSNIVSGSLKKAPSGARLDAPVQQFASYSSALNSMGDDEPMI